MRPQLRRESAEGRAADQMALDVEGVVDRGVVGEELLGGSLGFETLLLPLSASDRQVGVLDAIILSKPAGAVKVAQTATGAQV